MRLNKSLLFLLVFSPSVFAAKFSCEITEAIERAVENPKIAGDADFWKGLAKIKVGDDVAAKGYLRKAGVDVLETKSFVSAVIEVPKAKITSTQRIEFNSKTEKLANALQPQNIRNKMDEFIAVVSKDGLSALRDTQSSWQLKQLYMYGEKGEFYTVRLNHGYRVAFESRPDGTIRIIDIGKNVSH